MSISYLLTPTAVKWKIHKQSQRRGKIKCKKKRMTNNCWRGRVGNERKSNRPFCEEEKLCRIFKPQIICQTQSNGKHLGRGRTCCTSIQRNRPFKLADERGKNALNIYNFVLGALWKAAERWNSNSNGKNFRLSRSRSQSQVWNKQGIIRCLGLCNRLEDLNLVTWWTFNVIFIFTCPRCKGKVRHRTTTNDDDVTRVLSS